MELLQVLRAAQGIADEVLEPRAGAVDEAGAWPEEGLRALLEAGLGGLVVPRRHGGLGQGLLGLTRVSEVLGGACASTAMCFGMHVVGSAVLAAKATPEQARDYLEPICAGRHLTSLALSEAGSGAHFHFPETRMVRRGETLVLDGRKSYVTSGGHADSYVVSVVSARPEAHTGEFSCVVVPADAPGLAWGPPWRGLGMRGNASRNVALESVEVPAGSLLGREGDQTWYVFEVVTPYFLMGMTGTYLGVAARALGEAMRHLTGRRHAHSGRTLSAQDVLQHRVGALWARLEGTRRLAYHAARGVDSGDGDALPALLAAKAEAAECAVDLANEALTLVGGTGYAEDGLLGRLLRDARAAHVMAPTTDVLRLWTGRTLLGERILAEGAPEAEAPPRDREAALYREAIRRTSRQLTEMRPQTLDLTTEGVSARLLELVPVGAVLATAEGFVVEINDRARTLLGLTQGADASGEARRPRLLGEILPGWSGEGTPALPSERRMTIRGSGWTRHVRARAAAVPGSRPPGVLVVLEDVTVEEEARRALSSTADRLSSRLAQGDRDLEQVRQERDSIRHFIATLTHDLRSPLAAAFTSARLLERILRDAPGDARVNPSLDRIVRNLHRADRMIQDLLDLSRHDVGASLVPQRVPTRLDRLVREAVADLAAVHRRSIEVDEPVPEVEGAWDPDGLQRVLENLVGNAVKYGEPGTPITVWVGDTADQAFLQVHNRGPAIPVEVQKTLFEPFYRAAAPHETDVPGWGVGLAFVRAMAEAHGGSVAVSSRDGEGTRFTVLLPKQAPVGSDGGRRVSGGAPD